MSAKTFSHLLLKSLQNEGQGFPSLDINLCEYFLLGKWKLLMSIFLKFTFYHLIFIFYMYKVMDRIYNHDNG